MTSEFVDPKDLEPADHSYLKQPAEVSDATLALLPQAFREEVRIRTVAKRFAKKNCRFCHGGGVVPRITKLGTEPSYCVCVLKRGRPDILFPPPIKTPPGEPAPGGAS